MPEAPSTVTLMGKGEVLLPCPGYVIGKTSGQSEARLKSESGAGCRDVGQAVAHIALACRSVADRGKRTHRCAQPVHQIIDADACATSDVEHAANARSVRRFQ